MFNTFNRSKLLESNFALSDTAIAFEGVARMSPGSRRISHGLMILTELAGTYEQGGQSLQQIAYKYGFVCKELLHIGERLELAGLVVRDPQNPHHLSLRREPKEEWIYEVLPIIKDVFRY